VKKFLRENWIWLLIPLLVLIGVLVALFAGGEAEPRFDYPL